MTISLEELLLRLEDPKLAGDVEISTVVLIGKLDGQKESIGLTREDTQHPLQLALKWVRFDKRAKELVRGMDQRSDFAAPERTPVPVDPDLETSAPRAFLEPDPVPRLFSKDEDGERRFYLRNPDGTIQQLPLAPSPTVESVLTEAARLGIRRPYTAVQKRLTEDELQQALMNVGVDLRCGTCAEIFYTGSSRFPHTCARSAELPQDRAEEEAVLAEDRTEQARLEELALQEEAEDEARRQSRSWDSDP